MKRLILILLCLPLFIFSQEERQYEKEMSFSQFAQELKEAAENNIGYTLNNCKIIFNKDSDRKYFKDSLINGNLLFQIKNVHFHDTSVVTISNCTMGEGQQKKWDQEWQKIQLELNDCHFGTFILKNNSADILIQNSVVVKLLNFSNNSNGFFKINDSDLNFVSIISQDIPNIIRRNTIAYLYIYNIADLRFWNNRIGALKIGGSEYEKDTSLNISIQGNTFYLDDRNLQYLALESDSSFTISKFFGIMISSVYLTELSIRRNTFENENIQMNQDSLLNLLKDHDFINNISKAIQSYPNAKETETFFLFLTGTYYVDKNKEKKFYRNSWSYQQKLSFLQQFIKEYKLKIYLDPSKSDVYIYGAEIDKLFLSNDTLDYLKIQNTKINSYLDIDKNKIDSMVVFSGNTLPLFNACRIDANFLKNIGFVFNNKNYYGLEDYATVKNNRTVDGFNSKSGRLIETYKQFIHVLKSKGSSVLGNLVIKLKDIQTKQKMYEYYEDPNTERWFNWKGSEFLKWYSDYGMNPFKALSYCFWAMLFFAMFYFFFYSDWDKIDRGFLIKRFNSVMDYFTTEKRIEDFYSSTHDKEMTTFTEFKDTLDKNKVYMPTMLGTLAKPIYQLSLLRYKLLNFSYKKAEFMAGRKWVDLEKKDRYLIGTLTFFLTLTYITYLVFIRALNSIVLSINAFSTLGFGQIPVRGFTKYVAIIEGFIGWFMLSVFIVSILSQMMSV